VNWIREKWDLIVMMLKINLD